MGCAVSVDTPAAEEQFIEIKYQSELQKGMTVEQMNEIVNKASINNKKLKVGGELRVDQKCEKCYQVLQGPASVVDKLYAKIAKDKRHAVVSSERTVIARMSWGMKWQNNNKVYSSSPRSDVIQTKPIVVSEKQPPVEEPKKL